MIFFLHTIADQLMDEYNDRGHQVTIKAGRHTLAVRWDKDAPLAARLQLDADICRALGIKPRRKPDTNQQRPSRQRKQRTKKPPRHTAPPPQGAA
ncbi:MAG: hypothetical protein R6X15_05295 [Pseudomonadota bacterium]